MGETKGTPLVLLHVPPTNHFGEQPCPRTQQECGSCKHDATNDISQGEYGRHAHYSEPSFVGSWETVAAQAMGTASGKFAQHCFVDANNHD